MASAFWKNVFNSILLPVAQIFLKKKVEQIAASEDVSRVEAAQLVVEQLESALIQAKANAETGRPQECFTAVNVAYAKFSELKFLLQGLAK
jgi:hypothetical protein